MSKKTASGAASDEDSKGSKIKISGAGIYDPRTKTFDFPTPRDPDYFVSLDSLRGHEALLREVCHWREKGIPCRQIVGLLEDGAAVLG